jgi:hypothetical protein
MLVDIGLNDNILEKQFSGVEIYEINDNGSLFGLIRSPNHPVMPFNPERNFNLRIKDYMNYYVNDSVLVLDSINKRLSLGRDWPGNVMIYYCIGKSLNGLRFIACDNIVELSKKMERFELSNKGISQYLEHRKYYQSYTAVEGIKIVQPGFCLEVDLLSEKVSFNSWYNFYSNILIQDPSKAVLAVRKALDASLGRLVSRDDEIALMFSGGSDSALLLDRLTNLGYKNVSLYNVGIKGRNSEKDRAKRTAGFYGFKVNQLDIERDKAIRDWIDAVGNSYMGRSYSRINGWLSVLPSLYRNLAEHYKERRVNVMWGFVHPFILNNFKLVRMSVVFTAFVLAKNLKSLIRKYPEAVLKILPVILGKIAFLDKDNYTEEEYTAFKDTMLDFLIQVKHPDELTNLKFIMGQTNQKVWTMNRQKTMADKYCPQARNVFPFVDRQFQEVAVTISLRARFGGFINWLNASNVSRKNLTLKAFENKLPKEYLLGGNYESEPDWQSLYKNEYFYATIEEIITGIKTDADFYNILKDNSIILPESEDEFNRMRYSDIETMMSAVMLSKSFRA